MKRKILISAMMFAIGFLALPPGSYASADKKGTASVQEYSGTQVWQGDRRRRGRGKQRRWKRTRGYRNYGQYRRTQVGNRRYRLVRRYYWTGGYRRYRLVRVYY
jgi:hypothetical protein